MTEQITIKLNRKKFESILAFLQEFSNGMSKTNSEIAAKSLFFNYIYLTSKIEGNKTRRQIITAYRRKFKKANDLNEELFDFQKLYNDFLKNGVK